VTADFTGEGSSPAPNQTRAAERSEQGADYLRRCLRQIPGVDLLATNRAGEVKFTTPAPSARLVEALASAGADLRSVGPWESTALAAVGWWHRKRQLSGLADAIGAFVEGKDLTAIEPDRFDSIPDDLPRRRLGTID
jgi:hypothetical protein